MKTMLCNFIYVLRSFRLVSLLNILGLAVAFATVIVIFMQVGFERNFDKCHSTSKRVYRVDLSGGGTFSVILPRGFVEYVIHSSAHIEAGTAINPYAGDIYFTVGSDSGEQHGYSESVLLCNPDIVKIFDFPILEGDANCLSSPDKVIIPQSMANKFFGSTSAVGKPITALDAIWTKEVKNFTIGAVYKDFPENTQLRNVIYTAITPEYDMTNFRQSNYVGYLLLDDAKSAKIVEDNCNKNFDFGKIGKPDVRLSLVPLEDIYYMNESQDGTIFKSGNRETANLISFIALLIIIIATINFANFNASLAPMRIKSINTQKIMGASELRLRLILVGEAIIMCLVGWAASLFIVYGIFSGNLLPFIEADFSFGSSLPIIFMVGFLAVLVGLFAGFYPARFVTSFAPALVLKGSFGLSSSGRKLRTVLIGVQFVISILFIICAGFVHLQSNYLRNYSLGFDKDQVVIVNIGNANYNKYRDLYVNKLKEFSAIEHVGFARQKLASQDGYSTNSTTIKGDKVQYFLLHVSSDFFDAMGIDIVEGRNFSDATLVSDSINFPFVLNRNMREAISANVGDVLSDMGSPIVGFVDNIKLTSLRQGEDNMVFCFSNRISMPYSYIRVKAGTNPIEVSNHIRSVLADIDPAYPVNIEFYDSIYNNLYAKENNLRSMITLSGFLAIIISLVGVFSLVAFETQYRRKEIGLRKVHGATVMQILVMFNRTYLRLVLICFLVAAPLAYYGVSVWIEGFVYRTPLYWWIFVLSLFVVTLVTLTTVTVQNWRSARMNPVEVI